MTEFEQLSLRLLSQILKGISLQVSLANGSITEMQRTSFIKTFTHNADVISAAVNDAIHKKS
jgi:hypothetical protein